MFCRAHPFTSPKFTGAEKCEIPQCKICEYDKSRRQNTKGSTPVSKPDTNIYLKASYTHPGSRISVNHFKYCVKGFTLTLYVRSSYEQYVG